MANGSTFDAGEGNSPADKTMRVQQLFVKHQLGVRAFILSLEPNFTDAEDLLQEVFLVITRKAADFQEGTNFFAWACTIARFKLLESMRRRARSQDLSEEVVEALCAVGPEEHFEDARLGALQNCLEQLAPKARQMMYLRYYGEHSPAEIARLVSWTPNAVRVALSRARTVLQECLKRSMRQEGTRVKDERLIVLVDAYLDGALMPEEKKELEQVLLESDSARREFWGRASLHGWTYAATKVVYSVAPAVKERRDIRNALDWWGVMTWFLNWKRLAGFAVAAVVVTGALIFFNQTAADDTWDEFADDSPVLERTNTVAVLTHGAGVVWAQGSGTDLEIGALLEPGVLRLKSGVAQIQFHNGARVILEGPAEFDIISQQETRLQYGKLTARVPPPAAGFKVDLKDIVVTDLGTEFGVNQPLAQPPQVHVFEGKVELSLSGVERPPQVLVQGQGAVIETNQVNPLSVNRSLFLTENEVARRESAELESRYAAWRHTNTGLDRDPAMLVHFNFENGRSGSHSLANRSRQIRKGTTGSIVNADWVEGRWPAKKALEFKDPNDRVRLSVPDRHDSLTYMAWIRVDSLPNQNNALALTERRKPGEVHWQINRQGRLILSVRQVSTNGWEGVGSSKPVVTTDWLGRWMHVAAVYDGPGKMMTVYANGELVGSRKISKPMELELGGVELGNWARRANSPGTTRDFNGRMDEFSLLSRPLSAAEIRRQYELGKPFETMMVAALPASAPAGTRR